MKKNNGLKVLSAITGAQILLSGCGAAVPAQQPAPVPENAQEAALAAAEKQQAEAIASTTVENGVTYANGIKVETVVRIPAAAPREIANVQGEFSFNQNVITPNDAIFNLFGTAVTSVCASPARPSSDAEREGWEISVTGDVRESYTARLLDLAEKGSETRIMTCACANNPAGGSVIANAAITGVPVRDIIEMAGINEGANTVEVISDNGYSQPMPLSYLLERDALLVYQINGETLPDSLGGTNQLWMPASVAKYFTRRVAEIRLTHRDEAPALLTDAPQEGEFVNRPNIGIVNYAGNETFSVGEPITFEGYADDYGRPIARVEFSMDGGKTWTPYETAEATGDKWVYWFFTYTPEEAGSYSLEVRSVTEDGTVSPLSSIMNFDVE